jgi:hypothetical protein
LVAESQHGASTNAHIEFAWLIATKGISQCYDEAIGALSNATLPPMFPIDQYRTAGAHALILAECDQQEAAGRFAAIAIAAASRENSGMRYHKWLGLVTNPDRKIYKRLKRLSAA